MIWEIIEKELNKKEWSVYRLSKKSGVHENTIQNIKKHLSVNPGIKTMIKIADALEISLDEFREEDENEKES